jgi:hypothetical protein
VRFLPFRVFLSAAAVLGVALVSGYAADERKFTGREAEAVALAVKTFQAEHRKEPKFYGDLKHYSVSVERQPSRLEVAFIPDPSPKPKLAKNQYWLEFGSTIYGSGVTYVISLDRMKILKETFMR